MATFTFPYWAKPVLDFYNLKWPDIDEDQIPELGHQIQELANNAYLFSLAVKVALGHLADESESQALSALHEGWGEYTDGPVQTFTDGIGNGAVATTLAIANGVTIYKAGVLAALTLNAAGDIALITTGVGVAAAVAKKAVMRELLETVFEAAAHEAANQLRQQWNDAIDHLVLDPLEKMAKEIGEDLGGAARRVAVMSVPTKALAAPGAALYIDHHAVLDAVGTVAKALDRLITSAESLASWSKGTGYTTPTPAPDTTLSSVLKQSFDWAADAFVGEVKHIGNDIVAQMSKVITDTYDKYVEADAELGQLARELQEKFSIPVVTQPYVIDRSTRPAPVEVVEAPTPVVTGQGVSEARTRIVPVDLLDAPAPVVTGVAESDTRASIRSIVLPDAPEPVVTGVAESDARHKIRPV